MWVGQVGLPVITGSGEVADPEECAKIASLRAKDVESAFEDVKNVVNKWRIFAEEVGVRHEMINAIENCLVNTL